MADLRQVKSLTLDRLRVNHLDVNDAIVRNSSEISAGTTTGRTATATLASTEGGDKNIATGAGGSSAILATAASEGGDLTITTGAGGASTNTGATGSGGDVAITVGAGGSSSVVAVAGGEGGTLISTSGVGGATSVAGTAGAGGALTNTAGAGGTSVIGTSGAGGAASLISGAGGVDSGAGVGGVGGASAITAGAGGATTAGTGGAGGTVTITAGAGGTDNGSGGDVNLVPGALDGTGAGGEVLINGTGFVTATFNESLPAGMTNQTFFVVDRAYQVKAIRAVLSTVETADGDISIRRAQGTEAPTAGDLLTAAVIDATAVGMTADTVLTPALTATTASLILTAGERLTIQFETTQTQLAGLAITVLLAPLDQ